MRALVLLLLFVSLSFAQTKYTGQTIEDILELPEEEVNIGFWALVIAKEFDSSVDVDYYLEELNRMTREINLMIAGRDGDFGKFAMTRMFIYELGIWNNFNPFQYDLDDPLGSKLENQLLSTYIDTRKGNCVSMPTLFLSLMERVDRDVHFVGSNAPLHLFCRFRDRQTKDVWNVETTNQGSPARNQWYIERMNISQKAVEKGSYLRDLTKKEFIGMIIGTIIAKHIREENYKRAFEYARIAYKLSPNSIHTIITMCSLYAWLGYELALKEVNTEEDKRLIREYGVESTKYLNMAKELGWKQRTKEEEEKYLAEVEAEKERLKNLQQNGR